MTKIYLLTNIVIVSAIIIICAISKCDGVISDKRLCYDPECSVPVSLARTLLRYNSIEPHVLSFPTNTEIVIFSKEAGTRKDLWGAEIRGRRGYVPKNMVREFKTLKSNLSYEVPTEFVEKEVNTTDKREVDDSNRPNTQKDIEKVDVKVNSIIDESQNLKEIEKLDKEDANNAAKNESESSKDPEELKESERSSEDLPPDSHENVSVQQSAEIISESIQDVTPSFEVIDGTAIPLLNEEIPIKPSYSTPIIVATATTDEEPILSVHPSLPSSARPLISRFSNSDSQTIVEDNLKTESEKTVVAENHTGKSNPEKQSPPVQDKGVVSEIVESEIERESKVEIVESEIERESKVEIVKSEIERESKVEIVKSEIERESKVEDDQKIENHGNNSLDGDIPASEIDQPDQNDSENSDTIVKNVEKEEDGEVESPDNSIDVNSGENGFVSAVKAAGSAASDTIIDGLEKVKNIIDNLANENVDPNTDESNEDLVQMDLDSNTIHQEEFKSDNDNSEIIKSGSELEGTIQEQEHHNSQEQTEHLSDEKIIDTSKEMDRSENVGERTAMQTTEIPLDSQTVQQSDNQVIAQEGVANHHEDSTVHNPDDFQVETEINENSENNSQEEIVRNDYPFNIFNPGSEEVSNEIHSNLEEEKPTTTRNLLMVEDDYQSNIETPTINQSGTQSSPEYENETYNEPDIVAETPKLETVEQPIESTSFTEDLNPQVAPSEACDINSDCAGLDKDGNAPNENAEEEEEGEDEGSYSSVFEQHNYLETLLYLSLTAFTTLLFSLGYYYIENQRRDKELVAKINILEKELLVTTKESMILNEGLKTTKHKLDSIEDESFGSNEMVLSLKSELETAQITKGELEDQIITLEKELESATEAGLELERMLREFLASQSDENPLAQSVEDLQTRLNAQQATNESLTNSLNLKSQENEALTTELALAQERCQQVEVEVTRLSGEMKTLIDLKNNTEQDFSAKIAQLTKQVNRLSEERAGLITQLTSKEMALNDLSEIIKQQSTNDLDLGKLYDLSHIKAEAQLVTKERDELKIKLTEVEGAHELLEEHMKLIKEEIASVTEQYELAERDKTEAQTRLEVLSNYFKEKESQLQKELGMQEAMWVQKQGEVTSTVDRIQTMQNEIQNYRQQIETLKREILDQEREYKSQIAALETKSHEQWVIARQSERRLEESKAEASQLRNRLTMVEKSINEVDSDAKIHRLETNGETASSPQLFMGAETSSSPILFTGSSGVPPLPPSYMYGAPLPPPFIPPPPHSGGGPMYDISRRPPPLGGRLSSPPPIPPLHHPSGRYEDASSPPPPLSPPLHPQYNHRSPPPFSNERIHPHPPPPFLPPLGTSHSWGDEPLPPLRNPVFHPHQRDQRMRNHKGSLYSSGDSLDKTNHTGKS